MTKALLGSLLAAIMMTGCAGDRAPVVDEERVDAEVRSVVTADLGPGRNAVLINLSTIMYTEAGVEESRLVWPTISCHIDEKPVRFSQDDSYGYEAEARTVGNTIVVTYRFSEKGEITNEGRLTLWPPQRGGRANAEKPAPAVEKAKN